MHHNHAGNLGIEINKFCFNNKATFGNETESDIAPIPHKQNKDARFNDEHFAVRIKRIVNGQDCREKLTDFLREFKLDQLKTVVTGQYYVIHDQI